jgi:hypothetical protein
MLVTTHSLGDSIGVLMRRVSEACYVFGVLAVFLVWIFLISPVLGSNKVAAQPQIHSEQQSTKATDVQPKGTEQAPLFVEAIPGQKTAQERAEETQDRLENRTLEGRLADWTVVLAVATIGLIIATGVLGIIGYLELRSTEKTIRASNQLAQSAIAANQIAVTNAEQQLRAYVTVQEVSMYVHRHPDRMGPYGQVIPGNPHTYRFSIILKNGGATPAINSHINISCEKFNGHISPNFDFPSSEVYGNALIGPQVIWHTPSVTVGATELQDPAVPAERYLWGWIEYDDIFAGTIRHRTEFCFQIIFERLPPTNDPWIRFEPHSRFNAADWDCLRPIDPATGQGGG